MVDGMYAAIRAVDALDVIDMDRIGHGGHSYGAFATANFLAHTPFFKADQINTPLLLYHGADDNNSGTYPIQSQRMIQALTGLGKTAVLYEYRSSRTPHARSRTIWTCGRAGSTGSTGS